MADQDQTQDGQGQNETPQRRPNQQFPQRSAASSNWRMKDDSPRAEPQARMRRDRQSGGLGSPQQFNGQAREASDTRLYVGNLLYSASKNDISQFFIDNGFNPVNITMSVDPETGRNPSYCFADFETAEEASGAIAQLNGLDLLGRAVRISPGVARKPAGDQGSARQYGSPRSWGQDRQQQDGAKSFGGYNRNEGYSSYSSRERDQENQGPVKKLYVGGLPNLGEQIEVEKSMKSLFDQFGIELVYVSKIIAPHESKAAEPGDHHYCFVELARPEDVDVAIESLDQKPSPYGTDGVLRVNKAREQTRRPGGGFGNQGGFRERRTEGGRDWRMQKEPAPQ